MREVASYRRILRSSAIMGAASVASVIIASIRTKGLAVLLGPAGVGLFSLYMALLSTCSTIAALGLATAGTREVADAHGKGDAHALAVVRRAMFWGTLLLSAGGGLAVWSLREPIAIYVVGSARYESAVSWLAIGVALSIASASQSALIQGMRRIGYMAQLNVYSAILNTAAGLAFLWKWGEEGLVAFVLVGPLANFLLGHLFVSRLPAAPPHQLSLRELAAQWGTLVRLGVAFMSAAMASSLIQLWIRVHISNTLGPEAVGHYQAAWLISMQYIGFVLGAMSAEYYPRLASIIANPSAAARLVNEQTEVALLLSAPVFILMMGLAPWIIHLLYSSHFEPSVELLRWQILGDALKVASWPLGFVILAAGDGKSFFWSETTALLVLGALITVLLPFAGLQITGIAFVLMYCYYTPLVYVLAKRRIQVQWSASIIRLLIVTLTALASLAILIGVSSWGMVAACVVSAVFAVYSIARVAHVAVGAEGAGIARSIYGGVKRKLRLRQKD